MLLTEACIISVSAKDISFNTLTTDNGLSQFTVYSLYNDENGLIWIGTRNGLNMYDGNRVTVYKPDRHNPNSLSGNSIRDINGNGNGLIFVVTNEGINSLDTQTGKFTLLITEREYPALSKINCRGNNLYFGSGSHLYCMDVLTKKIRIIISLPPGIHIASILPDNQNGFMLGTYQHGLWQLSTNHKLVRPLFSKGYVVSLYRDSGNNTWACTWQDGLYCIQPNGNIERYYNNKSDNTTSISDNSVRTCCEDDQGNIWIGTFHGLDKLNRKTKTISHYNASADLGSLNNSSVYCIIKDHQGSLWIGTYFGGVNYFNPEYEIFNYYNSAKNENQGLSFPVVGAVTEDKDHQIWIATEGGGVNRFNPETGTFKWYTYGNGPHNLSQNNIKALYYDPIRNLLWIGTHMGGLNKLDIASGMVTRYNLPVSEFRNNNTIRHIIPYQNKLLMANPSGVFLFDPATSIFSKLLNINSGFLLIDSKGTLWITSENMGVYTYNLQTRKLNQYRYRPDRKNSISDNMINYMIEDRHHNLWFATANNGIDVYNPATKLFENFNKQNNGLGSNSVYAVLESHNGRLLLATNQGFSLFDYFNKTFHNYNNKNGFPFTTLNENSLFQASDGKIYLGGIKGMVSFYENNLNIIPKPYHILAHRFLVNGVETVPGDSKDIVKLSENGTQSITLKSNHTVFSIEIATTNYIPANKDEIFYRLEGLSDQWINLEGQQMITYTNLPAGNYELIVRAKGINKPFQPEYRLHIKILPPFYKSMKAYVLYFVLALILFYFIISNYKKWIKVQESLKYQEQRTKDQEALNQSKLRFFTNISHEFRTPLTIIIGQIEMLLQAHSFTPFIYNKILNIYKNSCRLHELINELLDFRKQELGHMKLKVHKQNLVEFLHENYLLYAEYATTHHICFDFERETDTVMLWYDTKQLQKVITNLLSNAFKFTPAEGHITLRVILKDSSFVQIQIEDSGKGIPENEIPQIFNRYYQIDNNDTKQEGTGIGLALSKAIVELHHGTITVENVPGSGALFSINLLTGYEHFQEDEIAEDNPEDTTESSLINEAVLLSDQLIPVDEEVKNRIKGAKILIVEDNEPMRVLLSNIFEPYYQVVTANDGEEGLFKAREELPDLIVSDVMMPRMSGTALCKCIKTELETCHIPVVLLTARAATDQTINGLQTGADDYITKPFHVSLLVSRCNNLVNSRIILQEKYTNQPNAKIQMLANNPLDKELLDRTVEYLEKHIDDSSLTLNDIIKALYISRTSFFQKIKAITGQSPSDFVMDYRLRKAAYLLKTDYKKPISEISDRTGFSSPRYFARCFKELYHISPMYYRQEFLEYSDIEYIQEDNIDYESEEYDFMDDETNINSTKN